MATVVTTTMAPVFHSASGVGPFGDRATGVPAYWGPGYWGSSYWGPGYAYSPAVVYGTCRTARVGRRRTVFGDAGTPGDIEHESERAAMVVLVRKFSRLLPLCQHLRRGLATRCSSTARRAMSIASKLIVIGAVAALTGCVTVPTGPTYSAMPGSRKSFDQFQVDDASCRQYAVQATGNNAK